MSLVGKKIIPVPAGVEISIDGDRNVTVKGAKGTLTMQHRPEVFVVHDGDEKVVRVTIDEKRKGESQIRAYWGLTRSLIANMILGVTQGYEISSTSSAFVGRPSSRARLWHSASASPMSSR